MSRRPLRRYAVAKAAANLRLLSESRARGSAISAQVIRARVSFHIGILPSNDSAQSGYLVRVLRL